jgi:hypothetical protein
MYLLKVSVIWIVLYLIYVIGLKKLTFFNNNRAYLLISVLIGLILPLAAPLLYVSKPELILEATEPLNLTYLQLMTLLYQEEEKDFYYYFGQFMVGAYALGCIFMLLRFILGLRGIAKIYIKGEKKKENDFTMVFSDQIFLPFSFFHFVFISRSLPFGDKIQKVLTHEIAHVRQWHSLDVLFLEIVQIFFWFNPIIKFYKKSIKDAHEFLADHVTSVENKKDYIGLLLKATSADFELHLANSFFNSQILNRITMLNSSRSKTQSVLRYLVLVPMLAGFTYLLASNTEVRKAINEFEFPIISLVNQDTIPSTSQSINEPRQRSTKAIVEVEPFNRSFEKVIYYLDDVVYEEMPEIDPIQIKSVSVYKNNKGDGPKYDESKYNGAIVIRSKSGDYKVKSPEGLNFMVVPIEKDDKMIEEKNSDQPEVIWIVKPVTEKIKVEEKKVSVVLGEEDIKIENQKNLSHKIEEIKEPIDINNNKEKFLNDSILILLDGVVVKRNDLRKINPKDIKSMDVTTNKNANLDPQYTGKIEIFSKWNKFAPEILSQKIYPNPSVNGRIISEVTSEDVKNPIIFYISDITGKLLKTIKTDKTSKSVKKELDLSDLDLNSQHILIRVQQTGASDTKKVLLKL